MLVSLEVHTRSHPEVNYTCPMLSWAGTDAGTAPKSRSTAHQMAGVPCAVCVHTLTWGGPPWHSRWPSHAQFVVLDVSALRTPQARHAVPMAGQLCVQVLWHLLPLLPLVRLAHRHVHNLCAAAGNLHNTDGRVRQHCVPQAQRSSAMRQQAYNMQRRHQEQTAAGNIQQAVSIGAPCVPPPNGASALGMSNGSHV